MRLSTKAVGIVLTMVLALVALAAVMHGAVLTPGDTFGGGVAGTANRNELLRSVGDSKINGTRVTDDGTKVSVANQFVPFATKTALTPGANVTVTSTLGDFFTLTPGEAENINATTVGAQGQMLVLEVITSGVTSYTLTFNTNFKSTTTLATGTTTAKVFVVTFISDGTNYVEVSRTAAQ